MTQTATQTHTPGPWQADGEWVIAPNEETGRARGTEERMPDDTDATEVKISVVSNGIEEMRYEGVIDLDELHQVLMREFPALSLREF